MKQSIAIAHAMKKRAKKSFLGEEKASGFEDHEGNDVKSGVGHELLGQHGAHEEGAGDSNAVPPLIMKIMMGRPQGFSEGGKVANSDEAEADFSPNEFDDLHLRDDLEEHETGANSGDEISDEQEDHDRKDIIKKVMKSRAKKDRNPSPA